MTRWAILAIAFAVVACDKGERDRASTDAAAGPDSALRADPGAIETGPAGGVETGGGPAADTATRRARAGAGGTGRPARAAAADTTARPAEADAAARGPTGAEAMGGTQTGARAMAGTRAATTRLDLSAGQVRQLQAALNDAGCNAGVVDGVVGSRTRQAIACGLEKKNLGSNDLKGLYRALNLDF